MSKWFQCADGEGVVGRFVDAEVDDIAASEKAGKAIKKLVPGLESKIPGSNDVSFQRLKESMNGKELRARFPGAWDYYEANRNVPEPAVPVVKGPSGTPLDASDFIERGRIPFLMEMGFSTVEQIAAMTDGVAQNIRGAIQMRKKAQEFLART